VADTIGAQLEHLLGNVSTLVVETPLGPVTLWCDAEGDWHSTRVPTEDDADTLPTHTTAYGINAGIDPYDPDSLEDVLAVVWADGDSRALADVAAERRTHDGRGWTRAHDDEHGANHLVELAWRYAYRVHATRPGSYDREGLVKAAALLVAAIDTLDRAEATRG